MNRAFFRCLQKTTGFCIAVLLILTALGGEAKAQTATDIANANRQSENIQRQQLQRQQEDIQRGLRSRRPSTRIDVPLPVVPEGQSQKCQNIREIRLVNAAILERRKMIRPLTAPYLNKCLGVAEIQKLMAEITRYYIEQGYATARVYLPQQDLSTGILIIEAVEGKVSSIHEPQGQKQTVNLAGAFPGLEGEALNLRDIEQGLDQLNRLVSNHATMDIVPGKNVGESDIVIKNQPTKPWHVNLTADNYGPRTTGREQLGATVSLDDILGVNEFYSYTRRASVPFNDFEKQSASDSVLFSLPYGYTTFSAGYTRSDYNSQLTTSGGVVMGLSGDNEALFATLDRVVWRNQDSKLNVYGTLTKKTSNNFIAGQKLDVSSRTLSVLDVGAGYSTQVGGGFLNLGAMYSRGLKAFGALKDQDGLPSFAPRAQFDKYTVTAGYIRPFTVAEQNLTYSTQISGQLAGDVLYGTEQFAVGGIYTVRGFYDESLANDKGLLMRNDLALSKNIGHFQGQPINFSPYLALDAGTTSGRADGTVSGTMIGAAIGLRVAAGPAFLDVYTGHPIASPSFIDDEGFNTFGRFSISF